MLTGYGYRTFAGSASLLRIQHRPTVNNTRCRIVYPACCTPAISTDLRPPRLCCTPNEARPTWLRLQEGHQVSRRHIAAEAAAATSTATAAAAARTRDLAAVAAAAAARCATTLRRRVPCLRQLQRQQQGPGHAHVAPPVGRAGHQRGAEGEGGWHAAGGKGDRGVWQAGWLQERRDEDEE